MVALPGQGSTARGLFSAKVKAGSRTYFIDVQRAAKLWNLSASDLAEIQRSLSELQC
jgi:hypothetical protein